ncbi:putative chromatin assembly factor [Hamiltosporidium tvaerminnensis]|uniref:Putative chromatin assembly factor n=1 Tax=Hamiltosporidium tvaerminnensis TaxID=1176355 RepID=A0A4Q9LT71_9MICR|nr:putative chromatin assembly factor [Hamiltosporidium tvaerminnensis]
MQNHPFSLKKLLAFKKNNELENLKEILPYCLYLRLSYTYDDIETLFFDHVNTLLDKNQRIEIIKNVMNESMEWRFYRFEDSNIYVKSRPTLYHKNLNKRNNGGLWFLECKDIIILEEIFLFDVQKKRKNILEEYKFKYEKYKKLENSESGNLQMIEIDSSGNTDCKNNTEIEESLLKTESQNIICENNLDNKILEKTILEDQKSKSLDNLLNSNKEKEKSLLEDQKKKLLDSLNNDNIILEKIILEDQKRKTLDNSMKDNKEKEKSLFDEQEKKLLNKSSNNNKEIEKSLLEYQKNELLNKSSNNKEKEKSLFDEQENELLNKSSNNKEIEKSLLEDQKNELLNKSSNNNKEKEKTINNDQKRKSTSNSKSSQIKNNQTLLLFAKKENKKESTNTEFKGRFIPLIFDENVTVYKRNDPRFQGQFTLRKPKDIENPKKLTFIKFHDSIRPPFYGFKDKINCKNSLQKLSDSIDYEFDSEIEWEDTEDADDIGSTDEEEEEDSYSNNDWIDSNSESEEEGFIGKKPYLVFPNSIFLKFTEFDQNFLKIPLFEFSKFPEELIPLLKESFIKEEDFKEEDFKEEDLSKSDSSKSGLSKSGLSKSGLSKPSLSDPSINDPPLKKPSQNHPSLKKPSTNDPSPNETSTKDSPLKQIDVFKFAKIFSEKNYIKYQIVIKKIKDLFPEKFQNDSLDLKS